MDGLTRSLGYTKINHVRSYLIFGSFQVRYSLNALTGHSRVTSSSHTSEVRSLIKKILRSLLHLKRSCSLLILLARARATRIKVFLFRLRSNIEFRGSNLSEQRNFSTTARFQGTILLGSLGAFILSIQNV